ncbi:hypothetical protein VCRA2113O325_340007 [Vibrio crassostreae]|nr:hypothetical protein VCRA2113O322_350004 [Vibrio crassostreae]CAK2838670.1 hypothetical protein VCRA2113O323_360007 [Vibrio crassostreae]CAK2883228.1 hypothetical protein VCRA2113O325_340007 [Vibrio crassostreae]
MSLLRGEWTRHTLTSKVKGQYYSRAVDKHGHVIDFLLCERRDEKVAPAFFAKAICYDDQKKWLSIRVVPTR